MPRHRFLPFQDGTLSFLLAAALALGGAPAAGARPRQIVTPAPAPDLLRDLPALAQQRPWSCDPGADRPPDGQQATALCAWQNRLRVRRWQAPAPGAPAGPAACVSIEAQWWTWARASLGATQAPLWHRQWRAASLTLETEQEHSVIAVMQADNGSWSTTEWRWQPSARPATRRWEQGRWRLLAERAAALRPVEPATPAQAAQLAQVLAANLGRRAGEIDADTLSWQADALCLRADAVSPGPQVLELSYAVDDSRLEQRAAMQLQLARRFPKAVWLTPFSMIAPVPNARGGAKFYAIWREGATVKGQLWMPVKGNGPAVRLRVVTALPAAPGGSPAPAALALAQQVILREMMSVAARWSSAHD